MSAAETRLHETIADIAYVAGSVGYYSGDSRADIHGFIIWALEFEKLRAVDDKGNETYNGTDYMSAIELFALERIRA